jgi:hypothetical protein
MNWNNELQAAASQEAVIAIVNDFLARQDARFWSNVPATAHPEAVDAVADVHRWHHDLVQVLKRMKPASVQLQELTVLFLRASVRIHQLDLRDDGGSTPSNDEMGCARAPRKPQWC